MKAEPDIYSIDSLEHANSTRIAQLKKTTYVDH